MEIFKRETEIKQLFNTFKKNTDLKMHYLGFIKLSYIDLGEFFSDLIRATIQIKGIDFEKYFS
jgi:hypothetical protein